MKTIDIKWAGNQAFNILINNMKWFKHVMRMGPEKSASKVDIT